MVQIKVLFCCMGNICRSPMAEGVFRDLVEKAGLSEVIVADSAGTHADFKDAPPDARAQQLLLERGIDISGQRARRVRRADFEEFDLILVMDGQNLDTLRFVCPRSQHQKLARLLDFAPDLKERSVPDPYRKEEAAFRHALELIEKGAIGVLEHLRNQLRP